MKRHRREFLAGIGSGMFVASIGSTLAIELGLTIGSVLCRFGTIDAIS